MNSAMSTAINQEAFSQPFVKTSLSDVTDHLPKNPGFKVMFKNEFEQPSGSFKIRGIGNLISCEIKKIRKLRGNEVQIEIFASSGGNAGLAAACSAKHYNVGCSVFLPLGSKPHVVEKLQKYGAKTFLHGKTISDADQYLRDKMANLDSHIAPLYCHPYDNKLIWEGHSTIIDEIFLEQLSEAQKSKVRGIVCSVGGGGLYNGLVHGLERNGIKGVEFLLVETKQAPTMSEAIKNGKTVRLKSVNSVVTSLACSYLSEKSLENYYNPKYPAHVDLIDDKDTIRGVVDLFDASGILVEPACGAAMSPVFRRSYKIHEIFPDIKADEIIIVIACGGSLTRLDDIDDMRLSILPRSKF